MNKIFYLFGVLLLSSFCVGLTSVEESALFDIFIKIPEEYQEVGLDEDMLFTLKLVNLGSEGRIDVFLEYSIINENDEIVLGKRETVAVETQASFLREFSLKDIPAGDYTIHVKLVYADGKFADTKHSFRIVRETFSDRIIFYWVLGILLVASIIWFAFGKLKLVVEKLLIKIKVNKIIKVRSELSAS